MKKILFPVAIAAMMMACGNASNKDFTIEGTVTQARLEGQKIFLVPMDDSIKKEIGVDSTVIKDMKFQFKGNKEFVGDIRLDWRVRMGTQNLFVITEPGTITVKIDSNSIGGGTPQNEALQQWKDLTIKRNKAAMFQGRHVRYLLSQGDTAYAHRLQDSIKTYIENYREESRQMAKRFDEGSTFREFIYKMCPERK